MADISKTAGLELCVAYQKKHPLDKCESIMEKALNERIKVLRKGKLCYGCLKPVAKDHNAKKLPTVTNLQDICCFLFNNTPCLCSKSKNRQQPEHSKL